MYLHHFLGIYACWSGITLEGFFGSLTQLSFFTEGSTLFVNARAIMATHKLTSTVPYFINGVLMVIAFFFMRVIFYHYMIFWKMQDLCMYRY